MDTKRLTKLALLTAVSLILFTVEAQLPAPVPIPGVKLGLANIITVYAMFAYGPRDTLIILLIRVFLGSVFAGAMVTLLYSLGGGLLCFVLMLLLRRLVTEKQLWVCSVLGAAAHNLGQTVVAFALFRSWAVAAYLPLLLLSGMIAGAFTGLCAQFLLARLNRLRQK
ncbi:MAG: Gx transporter family protein [Oscillospiraceae bacterium]|nr:Gx transporter family protein [Oscillospiraceae bacterium]